MSGGRGRLNVESTLEPSVSGHGYLTLGLGIVVKSLFCRDLCFRQDGW
jgi:hypothetical protein